MQQIVQLSISVPEHISVVQKKGSRLSRKVFQYLLQMLFKFVSLQRDLIIATFEFVQVLLVLILGATKSLKEKRANDKRRYVAKLCHLVEFTFIPCQFLVQYTMLLVGTRLLLGSILEDTYIRLHTSSRMHFNRADTWAVHEGCALP